MAKKNDKIDIGVFAFRLIECLQISKELKSNAFIDPTIGSVAQKEPVDLSNKIINNDVNFGIQHGDNYRAALISNNRKVELKGKYFKSFKELVKVVLATKYENLSYKLIDDACFKWLVNSKLEIENNGRVSKEFVPFLKSEVSSSVSSFEVNFKLLNLHIAKDFKLGDVKFWYIPKGFWRTKNDSQGKSDSKLLDEEFAGDLYVGCTIKQTDDEKAIELGYSNCCYALDVLKILFQSYIPVEEPIYFEIDSRCKYQPSATRIIKNLQSQEQSIIRSNNNVKSHRSLGTEAIKWITSKDKNKLINTITNLSADNNELTDLVINSIKRFSNALSIDDLHDRIISLMTIWESLLLKNSKSAIKYSLKKYGPKIIYEKLEERRELEELLSSFYHIRSEYLHHAKRIEINLNQMREFQENTLNLIIMILYSSDKFQNKKELLNLIDEELDKSFNLMKTLNLK